MFSTTLLLNYFLSATSLEQVGPDDGDQRTLTGYRATLKVDPSVRDVAYLLNQLVRCYVIDRPALATQQAGQRRIIRDLYAAFAGTNNDALLSDYWRGIKRDLLDGGVPPERASRRLAADIVASMTEAQAVRVHHRLTGIDYGQVTDVL